MKKITRHTIGVHRYNSLLNELSITVLWYNMLSNITVKIFGVACSQYLAGLFAQRVGWQGLAPGGLGEQAVDGV